MAFLKSLFAVCAMTLLLTGCVNQPTEMTRVIDERPFIMFAGNNADVQVEIDGINMGLTSDYREGKTGLRIESGTHYLKLYRQDTLILTQKFYLSEGNNKTFTVKQEQ